MHQKTAVLTFTYNKVAPFFDVFLKSLDEQTEKNFDLIIINDGLEEVDTYLKKYPNLSVMVYDCRQTPAKNREYGLNKVRSLGYEYCILADSDDFFSHNRVERALLYLSGNSIVVNDLTITDSSGNTIVDSYFNHRLLHNSKVDFEFIKNKNLLGFSNTSFKTIVLKDNVDIPKNLNIVDWYFYTILLGRGYSAIFDSHAQTFYRQSQNNLIGINNVDEDNFRQRYQLKSEHYQAVSKIHPSLDYLKKQYLSNEENISFYFTKFQKKERIMFPFWWEEI